jgi:single-strand DNA-binding protein
MIAVEASLQTRSYEDKNGSKHTVFEAMVDNAYFCGDRQTNGNASQSGFSGQGYSGTSQSSGTAYNGNSVNVVIDDLSDFEDSDVLSDEQDVPF